MNSGKTVFAQLLEHFPYYEFSKCVDRYQGEYKVKSFSCLSQFLAMAFAQLTQRESLRDIETCLRAMQSKLYHIGFRGTISRNTLANANAQRDWRIYADFALTLIDTARRLYASEDFGVQLKKMVYALDSTTVDLCLSLFPWAKFRRNPRCKHFGLTPDRSRSILSARSWVPGLFPIAQHSHVTGILYYANQIQFSISTPVFTSGKKVVGRYLRSNRYSHGILRGERLSRQTSTHSLSRQRYAEIIDISDQQFFTRSNNNRPVIQMSLADRTVLQVDQTAPPHQSFLWDVIQRGQDTTMDSHINLCPGGYPQKTNEHQRSSLQHITDSERHIIREKPVVTSTFRGKCRS
jgi:hypothetical protein